MSADTRALYDIQDRDPDGHTIEPTRAAYVAFRRWAVATYGQVTWDRYQTHTWAPTSDV